MLPGRPEEMTRGIVKKSVRLHALSDADTLETVLKSADLNNADIVFDIDQSGKLIGIEVIV